MARVAAKYIEIHLHAINERQGVFPHTGVLAFFLAALRCCAEREK